MRRKIYSRVFVANFPDKLIGSTDLEFILDEFNESYARYALRFKKIIKSIIRSI